VSADGPWWAGLTTPGSTPREAWEQISARSAAPEFRSGLAAMRSTEQGRAALEEARQRWLSRGLVPPWEPAITPVPLAGAVPDEVAVPSGTTASRCTACRQTRLSYPGDQTDPWKHHFDHCPYPEILPDAPAPEPAP
jgi:hypothetical protein